MCGKGWFCDLRDGTFGFCYKCDNYPKCEEAGQIGEKECKEVCKKCNNSKKCENDQFCNYDDPDYGFCEMCNNVHSCDEPPINGPENEVECNEVCNGKKQCNRSEDCGFDSFCSWRDPEYGNCEMCQNTNGCEGPSDYIVQPEGQDECKKVCECKCNSPLLGKEQQTKDEREECNEICHGIKSSLNSKYLPTLSKTVK